VEVDFSSEETPGHATWSDLAFAPDRPVRFRYSLLPLASGCGLGPEHGEPLVVFRAEGDLDGDGDLSTFERAAKASDRRQLVPDGVLRVLHRVE
jgi:hypothetical protein